MAPGASTGAISRCSPAGLISWGSELKLLMIRVSIAPFPWRKGSSLNAPRSVARANRARLVDEREGERALYRRKKLSPGLGRTGATPLFKEIV